MYQIPVYYRNMSTKLSEVLDDIGVNEKMIMKSRKAALLDETMSTIALRSTNEKVCVFNFGSRSEGSTTPGLMSDADNLISRDDEFTIIRNLSEWSPHSSNLLMIQDDTTPPGYCLLQKLRVDAPQPDENEGGNHFVKDINGRVLLKNTVLNDISIEGRKRQGPSLASTGNSGVLDCDTVSAYSFKSMPKLAIQGLDKLDECLWPTEEMKIYFRSAKCFAVGVGYKGSDNSDFEWRISTSLIERCLMFNLNFTQLRCYILMKMLTKTFINFGKESYITSFMCKTVLFYCIVSKPNYKWENGNILNLLNYCMFTLNKCLRCGYCPHFIVRGNNLMGGKLSCSVKEHLLRRMSKLLPCVGKALFEIQFDQLGERYHAKLNMVDKSNIRPPDEFVRATNNVMLLNAASAVLDYHKQLVYNTKDDILIGNLKPLFKTVLHLIKYYKDDDILAKIVCKLLVPLHCTLIGSLMASSNMQKNERICPAALVWCEAGLNSDVASGMLKLASLMFCEGDMIKTAALLCDIEQQYRVDITEPICGCYDFERPWIRKGFGSVSKDYDAATATSIVAFCICYFRSEIHCMPHELQYELYRSTHEDLLLRNFWENTWMDCAVVDSLPYLYYLQYKTYSNLRNPLEQQKALRKLTHTINTERNLGHKETAYNLLGQCLEHEKRYTDALTCYMLSLRIRKRHNAAKIHICKCLAKIMQNP